MYSNKLKLKFLKLIFSLLKKKCTFRTKQLKPSGFDPATYSPRRFESCSDRCDCVRKFVSLLAEGRWFLPKCIV
jgi:hypothetical protein